MIKTNYLRTTIDNKILVETYSDENYIIKKIGTNETYAKAIDIGYYDSSTDSYKPMRYSYEETEELIKTKEDFIKERERRG